jgi:4-hydroxy-2-oxoheptanedioate aldolase
MAATRYWGLSQQDYYKKADVWPLVPEGEILVILMIEDTVAINNIENICKEVPGIGCLLIGEGDLTQELGCPRDYDNPELLRMMAHVLEVGKAHNIPVGNPHVTEQNAARILKEGYRFLMSYPKRDFGALTLGRKLVGRGK